MEALIPVTQNEEGTHLVDARMLHGFLGVRRDFSTWLKERINRYGFIEGEDYITFSPDLGKNQKGRPTTDYGLTLDMAKQLCMVENNEKGMEARKYFIECERRYKAVVAQPHFQIPKTLSEALRLAADQQEQIETQQKKIALDAPKVEAFDELMDAKGYATMNRVAKILGLGPNNLFKILRDNKVLMSKGKDRNVPYQKYMGRGLFAVKVSTCTIDGKEHASSTTRVTPKGIEWLRRNLIEHGYITREDLFTDLTEEEGA